MEEVRLLVSGVVVKDGRKIVRVSFLRGNDCAEGILPEGMILSSEGFSGEEVQMLENYLRMNRKEILEEARGVDLIRKWISSS